MSANIGKFLRSTVKRSSNILRRVGKTTRKTVRRTVKRSSNILRSVGGTTKRVIRKGTNTVGLTKRRKQRGRKRSGRKPRVSRK